MYRIERACEVVEQGLLGVEQGQWRETLGDFLFLFFYGLGNPMQYLYIFFTLKIISSKSNGIKILKKN